MGKVLGAIAGIALAIVVAVAAPYLAPAIVGALGSIGVTASLAVATAIATAVITIGAGLLLSAIVGKPSANGQSGATPTDVRQSVGDSQIIIGKARVGAKLTFFHPRQVGSTHYRYFVWTVAGHRCSGLTKWILNDQETTVDGGGAITSGPYAGHGWLWFERGEDDAAANGTFVAECAPRWTSGHRGRGIAKIYAKFEMVDAIVQAGMPNITAEIEGTDEVHDPRTGITGYTNNAALAFYWWMALPRTEGGFGCYGDEIDEDWVSAQANVCDEDVPLKAGGTEKRYALDGVMTTGADPSSVRDVLVTNMAGRFTYSGGKMLARPGYWVPVSAVLSEDDLTAGITYDLLSGGEKRVTEVTGSWLDPAQLYQQVDLPARSIGDPDAAQASLDLPFVKSHSRAERIQKIKLLQGASEKELQWPMNIAALGVSPMDTVQLATTRYALGNYAFTVSNWSLTQDFSITLSVQEENEDMYAWSASDESDIAVIDRVAPATVIGDPTASRAAYRIVTQTVAYPLTSTDTTISVVAFTGVLDDGSTVAFPAGAITGLTAGTAYGVFYPLAGGAYVASAAPSLTEMASSALVFVGGFTTANSGGGYSDAPDVPPGDGDPRFKTG